MLFNHLIGAKNTVSRKTLIPLIREFKFRAKKGRANYKMWSKR